MTKYKIKPLLSVVIPTYNSYLYLDECLKSVINQRDIDFSKIEVLVIDDGSTDNTSDLISNYENDFIQFFYKTNSGVSSTRNFGVGKSRGEYILFLDSDDVLELCGLFKIINVIDNKHPDVIAFSGSVFYDGIITKFAPNYTRPQSVCKKIMKGSDFFVSSISKNAFFVQPGMYCFKKEIFNENKFIEGILHEDNPFSVDVFLHNERKVYCLPDEIYLRRVRANSIMTSNLTENNAFGYQQSINYIMEKYYKPMQKKSVKKAVRFFLFKLLRCAYEISIKIDSPYYKSTFLKSYNDLEPNIFERIRFEEPNYFKAYNWFWRRLRKVHFLRN